MVYFLLLSAASALTVTWLMLGLLFSTLLLII